MKVSDILFEESKKVTYIGVRFSKKTENDIKKFIEDNNIPNPESMKDNGGIHCTVIYSRKTLDDFTPKKNVKISAKVEGFEKLGEKKNCLVMKLDSPELVKRHKQIKKEHGATHDWNDYVPHITLSTDAKDFDENTLPKFTKPIEIIKEYKKELDSK